MQVFVVTDEDREKAVARANIFCESLKKDQFVNLQMNPLIESEEIIKQSEPNKKSETTYKKFNYSFTIMVYYNALEEPKVKPHLSG